jgi:hypothetical protein
LARERRVWDQFVRRENAMTEEHANRMVGKVKVQAAAVVTWRRGCTHVVAVADDSGWCSCWRRQKGVGFAAVA